MYQHGYITKQQMDAAKKVSVADTVLKGDQRQVDDKPYEAFVDAVIDEVSSTTDFDPYTDGLTIYTTLDKDAQLHVNDILNTKDSSVIPYPDDQFQAGIVLLDTKTSEIRAIEAEETNKYNAPSTMLSIREGSLALLLSLCLIMVRQSNI